MKKSLLLTLLLTGLAMAEPPTPSPSIGQASMDKNGTIVLLLRAQTGPNVGDGRVEYKRDNPHYQDILKHLGGLKPGQSKPCPPWN